MVNGIEFVSNNFGKVAGTLILALIATVAIMYLADRFLV